MDGKLVVQISCGEILLLELIYDFYSALREKMQTSQTRKVRKVLMRFDFYKITFNWSVILSIESQTLKIKGMSNF